MKTKGYEGKVEDAMDNANYSPAANPNYNYMQDVKNAGMMNEVKTSTSGVPTWSSSDMNQANAKTK